MSNLTLVIANLSKIDETLRKILPVTTLDKASAKGNPFEDYVSVKKEDLRAVYKRLSSANEDASLLRENLLSVIEKGKHGISSIYDSLNWTQDGQKSRPFSLNFERLK